MASKFLPLLDKGTQIEHSWSSTVVNISSISGIVKLAQHHFSYNTSKAAAIHLTNMLAHEVSSSGLKIRINNIAPGVFEMTAQESNEAQKRAMKLRRALCLRKSTKAKSLPEDREMIGTWEMRCFMRLRTNTLMGR
jgi:NAD(P)-dependent dehydrogenase (short-subunit alcohol dehydrogenase family)